MNLWIIQNRPGGRDFAVYWSAARTLLVFDSDPYSELAAANAQAVMNEISPSSMQAAPHLDLPLYTEMMVFPFASIQDFQTALAAWMVLLEAALIGTGLLSLRLLDVRARLSLLALPLFAVFWVQAIWPLTEGNSIILATLFCVAGLVALQSAREEAAGVLLAMGSFRFLALGPFLLFIIGWSIWRRHWRLPVAYLMSLCILVAVSYFFFPNWFIPYVRAILANLRNIDLLSTGKLVTGSFPGLGLRFSQILTVLTAAVLFWEWWSGRNGDFRHMLWTASLSLALTPFLGFPTNPINYSVLIVPVALFTLLVEDRWGKGSRAIIIPVLGIILVGLWMVFIYTLRPLFTMFLPAPIAAIVCLYWVRWWAIRPSRTWADSVSATLPRA